MQIIPRILIGFIGTVVSLACYLAYFGTSDTESGQSVWSRIAKTKAKPVERKPKENVFTKYIILAMAKRNVYQFASPGDIPDAKVQKKKKKLERWAKQMIANSGRILDALEPNAFKLNKIVDDAGDLVDKAYVNAKKNLREILKATSLAKKQRMGIEKSLSPVTENDSTATPVQKKFTV